MRPHYAEGTEAMLTDSCDGNICSDNATAQQQSEATPVSDSEGHVAAKMKPNQSDNLSTPASDSGSVHETSACECCAVQVEIDKQSTSQRHRHCLIPRPGIFPDLDPSVVFGLVKTPKEVTEFYHGVEAAFHRELFYCLAYHQLKEQYRPQDGAFPSTFTCFVPRSYKFEAYTAPRTLADLMTAALCPPKDEHHTRIQQPDIQPNTEKTLSKSITSNCYLVRIDFKEKVTPEGTSSRITEIVDTVCECTRKMCSHGSAALCQMLFLKGASDTGMRKCKSCYGTTVPIKGFELPAMRIERKHIKSYVSHAHRLMTLGGESNDSTDLSHCEAEQVYEGYMKRTRRLAAKQEAWDALRRTVMSWPLSSAAQLEETDRKMRSWELPNAQPGDRRRKLGIDPEFIKRKRKAESEARRNDQQNN